MPARVGVGDAIVYDSDDDNDIDANDDIVFIYARASSTVYTVKDQFGANTATTTTDNDTWAVYRAYTSLANAEASTNNTSILPSYDTWSNGRNISNNATGTNEVWNIACYGDAVDTTAVTIDGWTTSANNYLKVYTPYLFSEVGVTQRHNGIWDDSKFSLINNDTYSEMVAIYSKYIQIEGLQAKHIRSGNQYPDIFAVRVNDINSDVRISEIIAQADYTGLEYYGDAIASGFSDNPANIKVWNSIFYNFSGSAISDSVALNISGGTTYAYNNTFVNSDMGMIRQNSGVIIAKNNIITDCTDGVFGGLAASSTNNAYSEGADPGSNGLDISGYASTSIFVDPANNDFRLKAGSPVINMGANLSADPDLSFTTDIQNETRTIPWDIGADEYYDAGAPTISDVATSSITSWTATITWTTDENSTSTVSYGLTTSYGSASSSDIFASSSPSHSITLHNLLPSTTYHFRVESTDIYGNRATSTDYTFHTGTT